MSQDLARLAAEHALFWIAFYAYAAAFVFYVLHFWRPQNARFRQGSTLALISAAVLQTAGIALRTVVVQRPPFQSLYESLAFFAWTAVVAYLVIEARRRVRIPGFFVSLIAGAACLYALVAQDPSVKPIFPALQSVWFFWHVAIAFGSYAIFVVAFAVEISYLIQIFLWKIGSTKDFGLTRENIARFHRSVHQLVLFGFPMLTFGIMSGAAWANEAWGVYWQWDPKETWSLITWFIFALYLHTRVRPTWRGAPSSVILIIAFASMVTTFIGVSWLAKLFGIPSLHLYTG
jgi:cytochrome c-type biogenesis protein CcsB